MSLIKTKSIQLGWDLTPTNNFTIYQPATPDGTFRIATGNAGSTTDIMTVSSTGSVTYAGTVSYSGLGFGTGSATAPSIFPNGDTNTGMYFPTAETIGFSTNGTERVRIDGSGNVGLSVTPSAWSGLTALQVSKASISSDSGSVQVGVNTYYNGGWKYIGTGYATNYYQDSGQHVWRTAPSGTAGNAISFTQAMTLDASGNLGLGQTGTMTEALEISRTTDPKIRFVDVGNTDAKIGIVNSTALGFEVGGSEKMRVDSFGNVVLKTGSLQEVQTAVAASDINLSTGNFFTKTISTTTTFTVSNVPTSGTAISFILDLTNGGSATVNWWSNVKWAGGTAPTLTASGRDVLGFFTYDAGTTWNGLVLAKDIK